MTPGPYHDLCVNIGSQFSLPPDLLEAQMTEESSGDRLAIRFEKHFWEEYRGKPTLRTPAVYGSFAACSLGLLQIMVETAYEIGFVGRPEDLFVPETGLYWGARRMFHLLQLAGNALKDYPAALAAYNGGPELLKAPDSTHWPIGVVAYVNAIYKATGRTWA